MRKTERIAKELEKAGVEVKASASPEFPQVEDGSIDLGTGVSVQVGPGYLGVARETGEIRESVSPVTGKTFRYRLRKQGIYKKTTAELLPDVKRYLAEAKAEFGDSYAPAVN